VRLDANRPRRIPGEAVQPARRLSAPARRDAPRAPEHHCSEGAPGGFLKRLGEGTWLGHVAEHVALEIQQEVGIPVSFGRTRETKQPGIYNMVYEMEEERVGVRAGKLALDVVEKCAGIDVDLDLPASIDRLKRTRERWALGPSTRSIVARRVDARDPPRSVSTSARSSCWAPASTRSASRRRSRRRRRSSASRSPATRA
jgi:cyanophycin synthetase